MKKLFASMLIVSMGLLFVGCNSASPTDVAESFLQAVKTGDNAALQASYAGTIEEPAEGEEEISPASNLLSELDVMSEDSSDESNESTEETTEEVEALQTMMNEKLSGFDYTLSNESIDGDKATVDVAITTYDLGSATTTALGEYLQQAIGLAFAGASEEYMSNLLNDLLADNYEAVTEKDYTKTVSLNLIKVDGEWKVAEVNDNQEAVDAMFGGMISAFDDFQNAFDEDDTTTDSSTSDDDILYDEEDTNDAEAADTEAAA